MTQEARILLVDDSEDARDITLAALAEGQFRNVATADSAASAYDMLGLAREPNADGDDAPAFDLVLLDIVMPEIDGVEACARIRASRRYRDTPILMVSSQGDAQVLSQAFIAGANDYLSKPVTPIEILGRVSAALRFKREIDRRLAREAELRAQANEARGVSRVLIEPSTGLLGRGVLDEIIAQAADAHRPTSIALLTVESHAEYVHEMGADAANRLDETLARELGGLAAPLGAVLGHYGEGQFLVVSQQINHEAMDRLANTIEQRLEMLQIEHGASAQSDHVRLMITVGHAQGDDVRRLPGRLVMESETKLGEELEMLPANTGTGS